MLPLIECAMNISEGRRMAVVDDIAAAITGGTGTRLLDRHSDADHHRSVLTFVAPPEAIGEAAFRGIAAAARLIDMEAHRGVHPRLGAADVVPFIPLAGSTLAECIPLARALAARVGAELALPAYCYGAAALRPERANLEDVRRGQYEGLKATIGHDPARAPDYGPAQVGRAGACIIGARGPLVAFNVYLTTDEVTVAQHIARAVRASSGGFRGVKALGLLVGGRAQVSMNFTDPDHTPIHRVVETIRREAARYGAAIHHSELVGLAPQAVLLAAARWYLQLDGFTADQVLENRLAEVMTSVDSPTAAEEC